MSLLHSEMGTTIDADLPDVSRSLRIWVSVSEPLCPFCSDWCDAVLFPPAASTQRAGGGVRGGERPEEAVWTAGWCGKKNLQNHFLHLQIILKQWLCVTVITRDEYSAALQLFSLLFWFYTKQVFHQTSCDTRPAQHPTNSRAFFIESRQFSKTENC